MSETDVYGRLTTDAELADAFGDDARGGGATRVVLPASRYPVKLAVVDFAPSKSAGTPGLQLGVTVTEGPFKGESLSEYDSTLWFTPGKPVSQGGKLTKDGQPNASTQFGKLGHMCKAVTGKLPAYSAMAAFGYVQTTQPGTGEFAEEVREWFASLAASDKVAAMAKVFRTDEWNGKTAIAAVTLEQQTNADGTVKCDANGNPFYRNVIANIHAINDEKNGLAVVKVSDFPKQEEARKQMYDE